MEPAEYVFASGLVLVLAAVVLIFGWQWGVLFAGMVMMAFGAMAMR